MIVLSRGERFKDARTVHNKHGNQTTKAVHKDTGIYESMISNLENDEETRSVGYDKIVTLANHYGVSLDYLIGSSNDPSIRPSIVDELGLTPDAVRHIKSYSDSSRPQIPASDIFPSCEPSSSLLSALICDPSFDEFLERCQALINNIVKAKQELSTDGGAAFYSRSIDLNLKSLDLSHEMGYPVRILRIDELIETNLTSAENELSDLIRRVTGYNAFKEVLREVLNAQEE